MNEKNKSGFYFDSISIAQHFLFCLPHSRLVSSFIMICHFNYSTSIQEVNIMETPLKMCIPCSWQDDYSTVGIYNINDNTTGICYQNPSSRFGSLLYKHCEKRLKEAGLNEIEVEIPKFPQSEIFYRKHGFVKTENPTPEDLYFAMFKYLSDIWRLLQTGGDTLKSAGWADPLHSTQFTSRFCPIEFRSSLWSQKKI